METINVTIEWDEQYIEKLDEEMTKWLDEHAKEVLTRAIMYETQRTVNLMYVSMFLRDWIKGNSNVRTHQPTASQGSTLQYQSV